MNEKYGIELELITNKFNEKINKIKKTFSGLKNEKIDMGHQIKLDNVTRQFEIASNEAEMLRNKLKTLNSQMAQMQDWQIGTKRYVNLQNEIDKTSIKFQKASAKVDNLNSKLNELETKEVSKGMSTGVDNLSKGIDRITSKIKRFAFSLFSIRSIWTLVSKASSAYLSQDTELANKLQSVWAGLGAMLAPIIEGIANILMKAVGYINIFIKALTGVDLLARASAKSIAKTTKSAKALNKALAGFDELNNLDSDTGSGIDAGVSNPFAGIKDEELPWANKVQEFGEWVKNNIPTVTGLLLGVTAGIVAFRIGLGGIKSLGIVAIIFGIVKGIEDIIDLIKDPTWKKFGEVIQDISWILLGFGLIIGNIPLIVVSVATLIVGYVIEYWDKIKGILRKSWTMDI